MSQSPASDAVWALIQSFYHSPVWHWINQRLRSLAAEWCDLRKLRLHHVFVMTDVNTNLSLERRGLLWHLCVPPPVSVTHVEWMPLDRVTSAIQTARDLRSLCLYIHPGQIGSSADLIKFACSLRKAQDGDGSTHHSVDKNHLHTLILQMLPRCIRIALDFRLLVDDIRYLSRLRHLELDVSGNELGRGAGAFLGSLSLCLQLEKVLLNLTNCGLHNGDVVYRGGVSDRPHSPADDTLVPVSGTPSAVVASVAV